MVPMAVVSLEVWGLESGGRRLAFSVGQTPQMAAGTFRGRQGLFLLTWGGPHGYKVLPGIWNVQILSPYTMPCLPVGTSWAVTSLCHNPMAHRMD